MLLKLIKKILGKRFIFIDTPSSKEASSPEPSDEPTTAPEAEKPRGGATGAAAARNLLRDRAQKLSEKLKSKGGDTKYLDEMIKQSTTSEVKGEAEKSSEYTQRLYSILLKNGYEFSEWEKGIIAEEKGFDTREHEKLKTDIGVLKVQVDSIMKQVNTRKKGLDSNLTELNGVVQAYGSLNQEIHQYISGGVTNDNREIIQNKVTKLKGVRKRMKQLVDIVSGISASYSTAREEAIKKHKELKEKQEAAIKLEEASDGAIKKETTLTLPPDIAEFGINYPNHNTFTVGQDYLGGPEPTFDLGTGKLIA